MKFRDESGNYATPVSSGEVNKEKAQNWAIKQIREHRHLERPPRGPAFAEVATDFWDYETSDYVISRVSHGKSFSRALASDRAGCIRPFYSDMHVPDEGATADLVLRRFEVMLGKNRRLRRLFERQLSRVIE